jgi:hypothetical protein
MLRRLRPRITYANVASTLALAAALGGGTAYALTAPNEVNSASIIDGEVKNPDIAGSSIGTGKIGDNTLTGDDIAPGAIGTSELSDGAVASQKIALGTIQDANIALGTITGQRLATGTLTTRELGIASVASSELQPSSVNASEISADAVGSSEIAAGAVGTSELAGGSVRTAQLGRLPGVRVDRSTAQGIADGGETDLNWTRDVYDPDGMHSTASDLSTVTIPVAGRYMISGTGFIDEDASLHNLHILTLTKNNAVQTGESSQTATSRHSISTIVAAGQGDAIRMHLLCLHHCTINQQNLAVQWMGPS